MFSNDDLIEIVRLSTHEGLSHREIAEIMGCGKSTIGDFLRKESYTDFWKSYDEKPVASGYIEPKTETTRVFDKNKLVFTSIQNNTFVHDNFIKTLKNYCEINDATLVVGTFHYNKNGFQNAKDENLWFDPKLAEYIVDERVRIADDLVWCGELNILPTAVNPISGLENYTGSNSAIIPHAKLALESIPVPMGDNAKLIYTTGAGTQRNYIQMKSGQKAEWHHSFSALVVEVDDDGDWFVRQLNAESDAGCFYDLDTYYTPKGSYDEDIEAINWGDIHQSKLNQTIAELSWRSKNSILDTLKPAYQFVHDILDQSARNHHNIKDPHFMYAMHVGGIESVEQEVYNVTTELEKMKRDFSEVIIVESNHDLALLKWLKEQDYRKDPVNALLFLELQLAQYKAIHDGVSNFSIFEYACKNLNENVSDIRFLKTDESFRLFDVIECGQHGHNGPSGSRGSIQGFVKQPVKYNIGHGHGATIRENVYMAGVCMSAEDSGYAKGASKWNYSHIITYKNGKRAIITIKNGKWRG